MNFVILSEARETCAWLIKYSGVFKIQVVQLLDFAGIVHLDIAPANIMIQKYHSAKFKRPDPDSASLRDIFEDARILGGYPDGPYSAEECERNNMPIYKLGDLGLVIFSITAVDSRFGL